MMDRFFALILRLFPVIPRFSALMRRLFAVILRLLEVALRLFDRALPDSAGLFAGAERGRVFGYPSRCSITI
jgi:hypothetical protein